MTYIICTSLLCVLFSCSEDKHPSALNESEFFFSETLASISKDDSVFYIGTEDGDIIRFNLSDNQVEKFQTPFERIYKVLKDTASYWVGTRDMGLCRCKIEGTKFVPSQQHLIPSKGADYSVYDIFLHGQEVFVATSQGLFKVRGKNENNDTLKPLFPADASESPLQVCSFQSLDYDPDNLFCASDSGVLKINLQEDKVDILGPKVGVRNLVTCKGKDFLYAFTGDTILVIDNGKLVESIPLPSPAQLYYHEDSLGINYFFRDDNVLLVKDGDLHNPECFQTMDFRYPTRTKCNNIIVNDKNHSLLVCDHAISLVGHHQDVFSQEGDVKLVCTDKNKIYYLIGNSLFCQDWNGEEKNTPKAYQIKDLTGGTQNILLMEVLNDTLYYVDSDNHIFKTCLYDNYFKNSFFSLFSSDKDITPDSDNLKVLSIGKDNKNVYFGVRDGLLSIDLKKNIPVTTDNDTILTYITNFSLSADRNSLFFSTLNDGVFCQDSTVFRQISSTDSCKFIRDIEFINDTLLLLTNQKLYELKNSALEEKPLDLKGFSRLFALNGHVYGVRNYGIQDLETGVKFLSDIRFNPNACLAVGDTIIACSTNGAWLFNGTNNPETVKFEKSKLFSRTKLLILLTLLLAFVLLAWIYDRYRRKAHLLNQIKTFKNNEYIPDALKSRLEKLEKNKVNQKTLDAEFQTIKQQSIPYLMAAIVRQKMEMTEIDENESVELIGSSDKAINTHAFSTLSKQIEINQSWINDNKDRHENIKKLESLIDELPEIDLVTSGLKSRIGSDKKLKARWGGIIDFLKTKDTVSKIKKFIEEQRKSVEDVDEKNNLSVLFSEIKKEMEKLEQECENAEDMPKLMDNLALVYQRLQIAKSLRQIQIEMNERINKIESIIKEKKEQEKALKKINNKRATDIKVQDDDKRIKDDIKYKNQQLDNIKYDDKSKRMCELLSDLYEKIQKCVIDQGLLDVIFKDKGYQQTQDFKRERSVPEMAMAVLLSGVWKPISLLHICLNKSEKQLTACIDNSFKKIKEKYGEITKHADEHHACFAVLLEKIKEQEETIRVKMNIKP